MHDPTYEQMFGALYSGYHFHSYLWEGWNLIRKLALVTSAAQLSGFPILQLAAATVVLTTSIGLHLSFMPYVSQLEHKVRCSPVPDVCPLTIYYTSLCLLARPSSSCATRSCI